MADKSDIETFVVSEFITDPAVPYTSNDTATFTDAEFVYKGNYAFNPPFTVTLLTPKYSVEVIHHA